MTLDFNADRHEYRADGVIVPSVTTVVKPLGRDYTPDDEYAVERISAAAERGTVLHDYIAYRLQGGKRKDYEMPYDYETYADAVDEFLLLNDITPLNIETPMTDGKVAGTPDLVCEWRGMICILDYKFVRQMDKSKVCGQLGGYAALCEDNGVFVDELYAIQFRPGEYTVYPVNPEDAARMWQAALAIYKEKNYKHPSGCIGERIEY